MERADETCGGGKCAGKRKGGYDADDTGKMRNGKGIETT